MKKRVFVDTNCFLHLRDLKDLPWQEVFPKARVVEVLIAPVVVDELDRLKVEKGGRIRDRCRAALALIEQASTEPGMRLQLRTRQLEVWLVVAEAHRYDWPALPRLDPSRPDDHLVAAVVSEPGDERPTLLSFDTGPLVRARAMQLVAIRSPEGWGLPPQLDKAEQETARLVKELAAVKATQPTVTGRFVDANEDGVLRLKIPRLEPLSDFVQRRLLDLVEKRFPRHHVIGQDDGPFGISASITGGISSYDAERYHRDYDKFLQSYRNQFSQLHQILERALHFGEVRFELANESSVTAKNLRIGLSCSDDLAMFGARSKMELYGGALKRFKAPKRPTAFSMPINFHSPMLELREERRDPTGYYWLNKPEGGGVGALTCDEFRPTQRQIDCFYVRGQESLEGTINIEVGATNLGKPVRLEARVEAALTETTWLESAVLRRLPTWIARELADAS